MYGFLCSSCSLSHCPHLFVEVVFLLVNHHPLCVTRPVSYPENHYSLSPAGGDRVLPYRNPSASFSSPSSGLVSLSTMGPPGITPGPFVRYKPSPDRCVCGLLFLELSSISLLILIKHVQCYSATVLCA